MAVEKKVVELNSADHIDQPPMIPEQKYSSLKPLYWNISMAMPSAFVPLINTYCDYSARAYSHPYEECYVDALSLSLINVVNHSAAVMNHIFRNHISAATNGGDPTAFLLQLGTLGVDMEDNRGRVTLFHTISLYACCAV